jgi:transposase
MSDTTVVVGGVDTHKDFHVAAVVDDAGRLLDVGTFTADAAGYDSLLGWMTDRGTLGAVGIEGCGSYGAGLARSLRERNVVVVEVCRPDRQLRRRHGKSDAVDAEAAARGVLSGRDLATPKSADGPVEAMRALRLARRSALKARDQATNQLHALIVTAPTELRSALGDLTIERVVAFITSSDTPCPGTQRGYAAAMTSLAQRWQRLNQEADELARELEVLVTDHAPEGLLDERGVGPDVAASLMIAAGDNPERLRSESSFAALCGVSPLDASSGKQQRHRLNRGGNRDANMALWRIVMVRLRWDPATRAYVDRRVSEGKTRREAMRCLKRYVARDIYRILVSQPPLACSVNA